MNARKSAEHYRSGRRGTKRQRRRAYYKTAKSPNSSSSRSTHGTWRSVSSKSKSRGKK